MTIYHTQLINTVTCLIAHSFAMADTLEPRNYCLRKHIAVRVRDSVLVLSKYSYYQNARKSESVTICTPVTEVVLWIYDLWTEEWRKYAIPNQWELPDINGQTGVVIGTDAFYFGSHFQKCTLWKLIRNAQGSFVWNKIDTKDKTKVPSPRDDHCAWEHGQKMWIFGGYGSPPYHYLNDHGDFTPYLPYEFAGTNNQLFSYDPSTNIWTNAECRGSIPSPRRRASTAMIEGHVWLYGGSSTESSSFENDFYKLHMHSFTWTKIEAKMPKPVGRDAPSLTPISASQLVLYGGKCSAMSYQATKPWIFDVISHTWREYPITEGQHRWKHTGITGLNSNIIILGGEILPGNGSQHQRETVVFHVRLEPKTLQQLAIQMIHQHRSKLSWEKLPNSLKCKFMGLE